GHQFQVVAMDGNPVPNPQPVDVLEIGTAERIDAVVSMNSPGVFVLGSPKDAHRQKGLGVVVEYANQKGKARWVPPPKYVCDYPPFGRCCGAPEKSATRIPMVIQQAPMNQSRFEQWTINGKGYDPKIPPTRLENGRRYRLAFHNRTDDEHPVHLHRSSFELV